MNSKTTVAWIGIVLLLRIALHFGIVVGQTSYVSNYDIDDNNIVNMLDLCIPVTHYGQTDLHNGRMVS